MGKVTRGILGDVSGSVGAVTFQQWKNKKVVRQKPNEVANPNTAAQQVTRNKFTAAVRYSQILAPILAYLYSLKATGMTVYNMFHKNMIPCLVLDSGNYIYDHVNAPSFCEGNLIAPNSASFTYTMSGDTEGQTFAITHSTETPAPYDANTHYLYIIYSKGTNRFYYYLSNYSTTAMEDYDFRVNNTGSSDCAILVCAVNTVSGAVSSMIKIEHA